MESKRILVTGSAGAMGRVVCEGLAARGHMVRGFDRICTSQQPGIAESMVGDITDAQAMQAAAAGMDAMVHLAANPDENDDFLTGHLQPNIVGLYQAVEAARLQKVERLVLASSIMVVWGSGITDRIVTLEDQVSPTCHYALTKLYAESMAKLYAGAYGHSAIAFRLGWLPRTEEHCDNLAKAPQFQSVYLSVADAQQGFACAVESATPAAGESAILFLTSQRIGDNGVDLEPTKRVIGYEPQDQWPANLSGHLRVR